jgi:uncharacterized protein (DUF3820 family)
MSDELEQLSKTVMPFGKHKGKTFDEVPLTYLDWLVGQNLREPLKSKLEEYLAHPLIARELESEES